MITKHTYRIKNKCRILVHHRSFGCPYSFLDSKSIVHRQTGRQAYSRPGDERKDEMVLDCRPGEWRVLIGGWGVLYCRPGEWRVLDGAWDGFVLQAPSAPPKRALSSAL